MTASLSPSGSSKTHTAKAKRLPLAVEAAFASEEGQLEGGGQEVVWDIPRRASLAWAVYQEFRADPGDRCAECWLLQRFCCCSALQGIRLKQRVLVVWHYKELHRLQASNTAKILLQFGAEILVWGIKDHEEKLRLVLEEERDHAVVLFPAPGSLQARDYAAHTKSPELPRCIVVLDGGWKETRKINQAIDQGILRCSVSSATRDEYGGTRKYKNNDGQSRVQTAAAFVALMKELGEAEPVVEELQAGLASFMDAFEKQLSWSGYRALGMDKALAARNLPTASAACADAALL